ncbi:hypothetical protein H3146_12360 [Streptomyces sp. OF3]|uniref:2TM domain-containing protein n=1 Tax=Streptomyces alkaliterrae TaxID=2213162 RepID=A0A7W3ZN33_9ACTN|nr:hypothetical protein [Streptomyces alkaliterrae]MBB1254155.1 hypothetical protein [Streptomyces alkaliterrae]
MDLTRHRGGKLSARQRASRERQGWYLHTAVFLVVQVVLWAVDANWLYWRLTEGGVPDEHSGWLTTAGRIWLIVWVIDTLVSWSYTLWPRGREA